MRERHWSPLPDVAVGHVEQALVRVAVTARGKNATPTRLVADQRDSDHGLADAGEVRGHREVQPRGPTAVIPSHRQAHVPALLSTPEDDVVVEPVIWGGHGHIDGQWSCWY